MGKVSAFPTGATGHPLKNDITTPSPWELLTPGAHEEEQ